MDVALLRDWGPFLFVALFAVWRGGALVLGMAKGGAGSQASAQAQNVGADVTIGAPTNGAPVGFQQIERTLAQIAEAIRIDAETSRRGVELDVRVVTLIEGMDRRLGRIEDGQARLLVQKS